MMKRNQVNFLQSLQIFPVFFSFYFHSLLTSDRVLYARKGGEDVAATAANLGGDKITVEEAIVSVLHPPLTNLTFHGRN